jgi:hypothetical protein
VKKLAALLTGSLLLVAVGSWVASAQNVPTEMANHSRVATAEPQAPSTMLPLRKSPLIRPKGSDLACNNWGVACCPDSVPMCGHCCPGGICIKSTDGSGVWYCRPSQ